MTFGVRTFQDREEAGRRLGRALAHYRGRDVVVVGLPRGGVPVAFEVASALGAPLDVILVRKLGLPSQPELAMGAIGEDGVRVLNPDVVHASRVSALELGSVEASARAELERLGRRFHASSPREDLTGRVAIVVDDGVATGATARAACLVAWERGAKQVVLAVPIGSGRTIEALRSHVDDLVCLEMPSVFGAVAQGYVDFDPVSDEEVVRLLAAAANHISSPAPETPAAP